MGLANTKLMFQSTSRSYPVEVTATGRWKLVESNAIHRLYIELKYDKLVTKRIAHPIWWKRLLGVQHLDAYTVSDTYWAPESALKIVTTTINSCSHTSIEPTEPTIWD